MRFPWLHLLSTYNNNVCMYTATLECLESPGRFCPDELGVGSLVFSLDSFFFIPFPLFFLSCLVAITFATLLRLQDIHTQLNRLFFTPATRSDLEFFFQILKIQTFLSREQQIGRAHV